MKIVNLKEEKKYLDILAEWHHKKWAYLNPNLSLYDRHKKMENHFSNEFIPSTYVAIEDELLGSAAIVENDMDTKQELSPWLASVFIYPNNRNKGIGSKLVEHVMKQAKSNGLKKLYLFTPNKENFYLRLGWQTIERTKYRNEKVVIMAINL
jgi:N-acetylglutamate synthase-like GNAT family acetyltransferase